MPSKPFDGSRLKIKRAETHLTELRAELDAYLRTDPAGVFVQRHKETGKYGVGLMIREGGIPDQVPAIFGDAIHNLRTALDLLANDLVSLSGVTPKGVHFPFAESEAGLEEQIKQKMKGADGDFLDLIRALKPWRGGSVLLRGLHDLDVTDKHKAIMKIATGQTFYPRFKKLPTTGNQLVNLTADFEGLPTVAIDMTGFRLDPKFEVIGKVANQPSPTIQLASGLPLAGATVVHVVQQMGYLVLSIVQMFEAYCFGERHADP